MRAPSTSLFLFLALAPIACDTGGAATCDPETAAANSASTATADDAVDPLVALYLEALDVARYPTPDRAAELLVIDPGNPALRWDDAGRVLVTTWTKTEYYSAPEYVTGYEFALYGETWFTTGTQVQDTCSASGLRGDALDLRLEQLLGLPPGGSSDAFLQVWIDPSALFRPCADPSVTATTCPVATPLASSAPDQVGWNCTAPADAHAQWLCNSWPIRYGNSDPLRQYPWTALGYTYDWNPETPGGVGPSEFVAPAKSPVVFEVLLPSEQFCSKAS